MTPTSPRNQGKPNSTKSMLTIGLMRLALRHCVLAMFCCALVASFGLESKPREHISHSDPLAISTSHNNINQSIADSKWQLVRLNHEGQVIVPPKQAKSVIISFNLRAKAISGESTCNKFYARLRTHNSPGPLVWGLLSGQRACLDDAGDFERLFFDDLSRIETCNLKDISTLFLSTVNSSTQLEFKRLAP